MNIGHVHCAFIAIAFASLACGCHGLQGVRYLDAELCEGCGADSGHHADTLGHLEGDEATNAPHPRFHPLPTRPVFEPEHVAGPITILHAAVITPDEQDEAGTGEKADRAPTPASLAMHSVLSAPPKKTTDSLSNKPTQVVAAGQSEPKLESSRRKPDISVEPASVEQAIPDAPPTFRPIKVEEPSSNDMWHPRAGN